MALPLQFKNPARVLSLKALLLGAALLLGLSAFQSNAIAEEDEDNPPRELVETLQKELIAAMKMGEEWDYQARYQHLAPVVRHAHHFHLVAPMVLGQNWGSLERAEKSEFLRTLEHLAIANMASNFNNHNGEQFRTLESRDLRRGQKLIHTVMERTNKSDIEFNYVLAKHRESWGIVNVIVDGVSDLALKRADYQSIIKKEGFDELVRKLKKQIDDFGGIAEPAGDPKPDHVDSSGMEVSQDRSKRE